MQLGCKQKKKLRRKLFISMIVVSRGTKIVELWLGSKRAGLVGSFTELIGVYLNYEGAVKIFYLFSSYAFLMHSAEN
jgi:hypothetical protein